MIEGKKTQDGAVIEGNAAGWAGVHLVPAESRARDVSRVRRSDGDAIVYRGLKPHEAVRVEFIAGDRKDAYRVVSTDAGTLRIKPGDNDVAYDSHDLGLSVNVGDAGTVHVRGEHVMRVEE